MKYSPTCLAITFAQGTLSVTPLPFFFALFNHSIKASVQKGLSKLFTPKRLVNVAAVGTEGDRRSVKKKEIVFLVQLSAEKISIMYF